MERRSRAVRPALASCGLVLSFAIVAVEYAKAYAMTGLMIITGLLRGRWTELVTPAYLGKLPAIAGVKMIVTA